MTVGLSDANLILFSQNLEGLLQAEIANIMTLEFPLLSGRQHKWQCVKLAISQLLC
jgi:hypothetical protein